MLKLLKGRNIALQALLVFAFTSWCTTLSFAQEEPFRGLGAKTMGFNSLTLKKDSIVSVIPDSLRSADNDLETTVYYKAEDSTDMILPEKVVHLYGNAEVIYGDIKLTADYIRLSWGDSEVFAHGSTDSTEESASGVKGKPVFTQGIESYNTDTIRYNFKSRKAIIKNIVTQQGEGIIQGVKVKKDPIDNLYLSDALYTTCNLPDPHFHIASRKIKLVNKKSVVSGPFNLVLADVPLPIGLPFGFFPVPKKKEIGTSGFIMGNYGEEPNNRGFYLRDFGYYHAFNEYIGAKVLAQVYSRGSWGIGVQSNYTVKYKFNGNLNLQFNYNRSPDEFSTRQPSRDFNVSWSHTPQNNRPDRSFSASVNLVSNSFNQNNRRLDEVDNYTNNTFGSSVQFTRNVGTLFRSSWGFRADQNVSTRIFNGGLSYNLSLNQFNPFVPQKKQVGKWYESFRVGLNMNGGYQFTNELRTRSTSYTDYNIAGVSNEPLTNEQEREINEIQTLLFQPGLSEAERAQLEARLAELSNPVITDVRTILENAVYNNSFSVPIALPNFKLFRYINITPSISYRGDIFTKSLQYGFLNPQEGSASFGNVTAIADESVEDIANSRDENGNLVVRLNPNSGGVVVIDTINGLTFGQNFSFGTSVNTRIYGTYGFGKKSRVNAIRHTIAPSFGVNYTPDNAGRSGYAVQAIVSEIDGEQTLRYLPRFLDRGGSVSPASAGVTFGITNQLEAKIRARSDTAQSEFRKVMLLDNLSLNGSYNLLASAQENLGVFALSDFNLSTNTSLFKDLISVNANATLDPYAYIEDPVVKSNKAGRRIPVYKWQRDQYEGSGGSILSRANLALNTRLSPETFNKDKKPEKPESEDPGMAAMQRFVKANPMAYVDFNIPWSMGVSYSFNYIKQGLADPRITQTLSLNGDLSLTKNTKITFNTGWDFQFQSVTLTTIGLMRQLHCWDMSFNWTPIAGNARRSSNYSFDLRVRSSLLQDLRISRRRQYFDRGGF